MTPAEYLETVRPSLPGSHDVAERPMYPAALPTGATYAMATCHLPHGTQVQLVLHPRALGPAWVIVNAQLGDARALAALADVVATLPTRWTEPIPIPAPTPAWDRRDYGNT